MTHYDYVIIGAGTAGCVLASRLSHSGRHRVLLVEAGGSDRRLFIHIPIGYGRTFNDPRVNWMYEADPDPTLGNRTQFWPRGKVLGGSSSINAMVYVRGHPGDFDDWAAMGNPGWGWEDVLPYFRKLEDHVLGASAFHGAGGPVHVSAISSQVHPLCERFIESCGMLGIPRTADFNGAVLDGAGPWHVTIKDGRRVSAATAYLRPALQRPNLQVMTGAQATRVLFDGRRASGVELLHGGARQVVRAHREVILSAGAINSPQLLELSGVGDAALLGRFNIPVILDAPAVGCGLQDHLAVCYFYRSRVRTLNNELGRFFGKAKAALRYLVSRSGPVGMSVNQVGAFVRGRRDLARPNLHVYCNPASYVFTTAGRRRRMVNLDSFQGFLMSFNSCRPTSRGSVHIHSADPLAAPGIMPNALSTREDIAEVQEGAQLLRRISAAQPLAGLIESELQPGPHIRSDEQLLDDFRRRAGSVFHSCSTCAMGPDPRHSVVDPHLRVHGLAGLRVVDASVFPTITSGNINTPTYMVAEKAADLILEDAGRCSSTLSVEPVATDAVARKP
jgi:choline dehydrogenase